MTGRTGNPFDRFPRLPVVPVPWPGEALGGWIRAAIKPYGLSIPDFMHHLGMKWSKQRSDFDVHVLLKPGEKFLKALNETTGISASCLRGMTLEGLDPDISGACFLHNSPCSACKREAAVAAGRRIELLHARSPWRVVCPKHPPPSLLEEVAHIGNHSAFLVKIKEIIEELDCLSLNPHHLQGVMEPFSNLLGAFMRFVYLLNYFICIRLEAFDDLWNHSIFRIVRTFKRDKGGSPLELPLESRNHIGISLVLAWQLASQDLKGLLLCLRTVHDAGNKTDADINQLLGLLYVAKEFWSGSMALRLIANAQPNIPEALTVNFRNMPEYERIISEVSWNYNTAKRALFSTEVLAFSRPGKSEFPIAGPFRHAHLPAQLNSVTYIEYRRAKARGKGVSRYGLEASAWPSSRSRKPSEEQEFRDRVQQKCADARIMSAVSQAIEEYDPIPSVLSLQEQRRILRKLQQLASRHLAGEESVSHSHASRQPPKFSAAA